MLDEGGVIVLTETPLATSVQVESALARAQATAVVFGHAIYEGIVGGTALGTARALVTTVGVVPDDDDTRVAVADRALALSLNDASRLNDPDELPRLFVRDARPLQYAP